MILDLRDIHRVIRSVHDAGEQAGQHGDAEQLQVAQRVDVAACGLQDCERNAGGDGAEAKSLDQFEE